MDEAPTSVTPVQQRPATGVVDKITDIPRRAADWMHETDQERQLRNPAGGAAVVAPRGRLAAMSRVQLVAVGLVFFLVAMAIPVGITLAVTAGSRSGESAEPPAGSTGEQEPTDELGGRANAPLVVPIETPSPEPTPTIDPVDEAAVAAATQAAEAAAAAARTPAAPPPVRAAVTSTRRPDALDALAARAPARTSNATTPAPPTPPPPAAEPPPPAQAAQAAMACANTTQVTAHNGEFIEESIRLCSDGTREVLSTRTPSAKPSPAPSPKPSPKAHCSDGLDNDSDGFVDMFDLGCASVTDNSEQDPAPSPAPASDDCHDGIDNDGDGLVDLADPGCAAGAVTETPFHADCADGIDNDGDGFIDLADPQCTGAPDDSELPVDPIAECKDGLDNDGDGLVDLGDPDCSLNANTAFERPAGATTGAAGG